MNLQYQNQAFIDVTSIIQCKLWGVNFDHSLSICIYIHVYIGVELEPRISYLSAAILSASKGSVMHWVPGAHAAHLWLMN